MSGLATLSRLWPPRRRKHWGTAARQLAAPALLERREPVRNAFDRHALALVGGLVPLVPVGSGRIGRWLRNRRAEDLPARAAVQAARLTETGPEALVALAQATGTHLLRRGFTPDLLAEGLGLAGEAVRRHFGFLPRDTQFEGATLLLRGRLVEMATGEGKTVTALLAAAVAALAGRRVHVVTVNGYLAARDCDLARAPLAALGLRAGAVHADQSPEERRAALAADVVFADNKELTFDYLRGILRQGRMRAPARFLLRRLIHPGAGRPAALDFAIVDEIDSVLIDEARTPLIIAESARSDGDDWYGAALDLAMGLQADRDFRHEEHGRAITLTPAGGDRLAGLIETRGLGDLWRVPAARRERIEMALAARLLYRIDEDYMVAEGKVVIIDEFTGRPMPDRSWQAGLHQLIEAKEGVETTPARITRAQITFRQLFGRYRHLAGMTGTGREVAGEIFASYGMRFARVPTHRPVRRAFHGLLVLPDAETKIAAIAQSAVELAASGRAVLIGTRSLSASERISEVLAQLGADHTLLNAREPEHEAQVIHEAGGPGMITVATNMAGRGADIPLDPAVEASGGLHVILTEFHSSSRIDRQLFGRSARQGKPGSWSAIVALDDELFVQMAPRAAGLLRGAGFATNRAGGLLCRYCQWRAELRGRRERRQTDLQSTQQMRRLAATGEMSWLR